MHHFGGIVHHFGSPKNLPVVYQWDSVSYIFEIKWRAFASSTEVFFMALARIYEHDRYRKCNKTSKSLPWKAEGDIYT